MTHDEQNMDPTALHDFLTLCHASGVLTWKARPLAMFRSDRAMKRWHTRHAGSRAGSPTCRGYREVSVAGLRFKEHRVIFAMANGHWPENEVDHINRIRNDNRPQNLRAATRAENNRNREKRAKQ
jgi:hypothetical protein